MIIICYEVKLKFIPINVPIVINDISSKSSLIISYSSLQDTH